MFRLVLGENKCVGCQVVDNSRRHKMNQESPCGLFGGKASTPDGAA